MTSPEPIFDRALLQQRRLRAVRMAKAAARGGGAAPPDFLLERVAEDLVWRLGAVKRHFAQAVVLGGFPGQVAQRLGTVPNIGTILETDTDAGLFATPGPRDHRQTRIADEEALPFDEASLDLVVSGLALQWVNDLPGSLIQIRRALKPDGLMIAALMGGRTLFELREAFLLAEAEMEGGASPRVAPFVDVRDVGSLLQRAKFALPVTDIDTVSVTYAGPIALMHELRAMGAGNVLMARRRTPLRRATLARAVEIYRQRFGLQNGRVPATFEIVTLTGWAPHDSQQKPLAPGSARMRLADALGTQEHSVDNPPRQDDDSKKS
jgi:NADH dehydrogenase [ubiquinone] 1 alpha subcomplex assembly factor 5